MRTVRSREDKAIVMLIAVAVMAVCVVSVLRAAGVLNRATPPPPDLSGDPALGQEVKLADQTDPFPFLVVALGECSGCAAKRTNFEEIRALGWPRVVFIVKGTSGEVASHSELDPAREIGRIVADEDGLLTEKLNIVWTPRWYVFSADGKLAALQERHGDELPKYSDWKERGKSE